MVDISLDEHSIRMEESMFDEVHDLRPLKGRNCAWLGITYSREENLNGTFITIPGYIVFRGTYNNGWDHCSEYETKYTP